MYSGGVVDSDQVALLKRLILRATRCQAYVYSFDLHIGSENRIIGDKYDQKKSVFILAYVSGGRMQEKVKRISNSFCDNTIDVAIETIDQEMGQ